MIRTFIFSIIYLLFFPCFLFAQLPVQVTIDATAARQKISPYIYGKNNNLSDSPGSPTSASKWQMYKDAGIMMFRESGGNNCTKYNWKRKLSSHPDWYNNVYSHDWDYAAKSLQHNIPYAQGMWAFQLLGKVAKTNLQNFGDWNYNGSNWWVGVNQNLAGGGVVNATGGSKATKEGNPDLYLENWPADSVVKILDKWFGKGGLGLDTGKIRYWGMDNEPEIWEGTHDDVMPVQIGAEQFMQIYFEMAKKARARFPGIKLCGPVPANEWQWYNWKGDAITYKGVKYVWLEYFILRVAEEQKATGIRLLDVLDIHFYPGEKTPEDIVQTHRVFFDRNYSYPGANGVRRIGGWSPTLNKEYILGRCSDWLVKYIGSNHGVTFGVSEIGIESNDANVNAVCYASIIGEFAKNKVELFTPWSWKTGMMEVLHLFSRYGQNNYINGTSSLEQFVSIYPTINNNSDSLTLFLVNRHLTEQKTIEIDIKNFNLKDEILTMYSLSKLPSSETFVSHAQNALKKTQIGKPVFNISVKLEPLSVNAIVLKTAPTKLNTNAISDMKINVYPNPVSNLLNLEFSLSDPAEISTEITDLTGHKLFSFTNDKYYSGHHIKTVDVSGFPDGVYFIRFEFMGNPVTKKFIIQH